MYLARSKRVQRQVEIVFSDVFEAAAARQCIAIHRKFRTRHITAGSRYNLQQPCMRFLVDCSSPKGITQRGYCWVMAQAPNPTDAPCPQVKKPALGGLFCGWWGLGAFSIASSPATGFALRGQFFEQFLARFFQARVCCIALK